MYIAYLDEFGHIGPYVSRDDAKYKTHSVFGIGGVVLPMEKARELAMFFFKLKCSLLSFEIDRDQEHPARWEKKGSALLTTQNITKYPQVRQAMNRILNWLAKNDGHVYYIGYEKQRLSQPSTSTEKLYHRALIKSVREVGRAVEPSQYFMVLDEQGKIFREKAVAATAGFMFTARAGFRLLEPPMQVESHLYQTVQCADWICALLGRWSAFQTDPAFAEFEWAERYFGDRLRSVSTVTSSLVMLPSTLAMQPTLPSLERSTDLT